MTTPLACGHDPNEVWESADRPPTAHQRSCPHCRRLRTQAQRVHTTLEENTMDQPGTLVDTTSLDPRRSGRSDLSPRHVIDAQGDDWTQVREAVVTSLVERVVEGMDEVALQDVRCSIPGRDLKLRLDLVVARGTSVPELAEQVRRRVADDLEHQLGARPQTIDISVEDLSDE